MNKYYEVLEFLKNLSDEQIKYLLEIKTKSSCSINIENFLKELGVSPSILGFEYLKSAIEIALENKSTVKTITKTIYPCVADKFQTTPSRVERAIRHAIETCWVKMDKEFKNKIFFNEREKPSNSIFIAYICNHIKNTEIVEGINIKQKILNLN